MNNMRIVYVTFLFLFTASFSSVIYSAESFSSDKQPSGYLPPLILSTNNISSGTNAYRTWYENGAWQGDIIEYDVSSSGVLSSSIDLSTTVPTNSGSNWSARLQFLAAEVNTNYWNTTRKIITVSNNVQVPFRWASLSDTDKQTIDAVSFATTSSTSNIINFVRGDRSAEKPNGSLRKRYSILGDIMHSTPVYVASPNSNIYESSYITFKNNNASRAPRLYVGANDGMLHVFDAVTGNEIYAFIPSTVFPTLSKLSDFPYNHQYFIDGEMSAYDAYFDSEWHTVLVVHQGAGGSTRFALDITNPNLTSESSNTGDNKKLLWIQDSTTDSALGDAYGEATVVKLSDGKYYSIAGNGYNSSAGIAQLILTNIETGAITKISTLSGTGDSPNGLSTPALINIDGDDDYDYAYAGDIDGNLWKFDLNVKALAYSSPLFTTESGQAITTKPTVTSHASGGKIVYFATGKAFSVVDLADTTEQAIYGIWDKGAVPDTHSILSQTLSDSISLASQSIKTLSNNVIDWSLYTGWKIALTGGDRVLTSHKLRAKKLQLIVTNPFTDENWLIEPNYLNGGGASQTIFDINADGALSVADNINNNIDSASIASAWMLGEGISSGVTVAWLSEGVDVKFVNNMILPLEAEPCTSGCSFLAGHIDVDTDSPSSPGNGFAGSTSSHSHKYDKKVQQPYVDYFQLNDGDSGQLQVDEVLTDKDKKFFVIVANADLSSKSNLTIGSQTYNIVEYQKMIQQKLASWDGQLSTLKDDEGNSLIVSLNDLTQDGGTLRNSFDSHAILDGGLHPTQPSCVKDSLQITNGRWRNGALITQLIDPTVVKKLSQLTIQNPTDLKTKITVNGNESILKEILSGDTVPTIYGGIVASGSTGGAAPANGLLYESTLFWHYGEIAKINGVNKVCYGDSSWESSVASEQAGITDEQFASILAGSRFDTLDEAIEKYNLAIATCEAAENVKDCQGKSKIDGDKVKDIIKDATIIIDLSIIVNLEDKLQQGTMGDTGVSGEPATVEGEVKSSGVSDGPEFTTGRRTWVDLTEL
ncbi:MAG: hypothetical protein GY787_03125 [Alteromonadales bacterium]|nr:hypothetical protein [Alteromonadales bacterium]